MTLSENAVCRLSTGKIPGEVSLNSMEWAVITQIDGERSVAEIAKKLTFSSSEAISIFQTLLSKGLIEIVEIKEHQIKEVPPTFFDKVEKILVQFIGPVAVYVINDTLLELNADRDHYPKAMVPELIELLSDEISDDTKKIQFQKKMLDLMREN